jgi:hypothetical protein
MGVKIGDTSAALLAKALSAGTDEEVAEALELYASTVGESMAAEYKSLVAAGDEKALAARGYKALTSEETKFYEKFAEAGKSANPKQALTDLLTVDNGMPETVIIDVFRDMLAARPLLGYINSQYVQYQTSWLLNNQSEQYAAWGAINSAITQEITASFRALSLTLVKLSAFAAIPRDMLDLGPSFIEAYMRTALAGSLAAALEKAVLTGDGNGKPIGANRDIHDGVTVTGGVYPLKPSVALTDFSPATYGELLADFSQTERGKARQVASVLLAVSPRDYFTKVMPATTALNTSLGYVSNLFPFPTTVVQSTELTDGTAIAMLPSEYWLGVGAARNGVIEFSDEYRFLEDQRVLKMVMHAHGRMWDNTSSAVLDISGLEPAYVNVKVLGGSGGAAPPVEP